MQRAVYDVQCGCMAGRCTRVYIVLYEHCAVGSEQCTMCSVLFPVYDMQHMQCGCMAGRCTRVCLWQWRQTLKQPFSHSSFPIDKEDDDDGIHDEKKDDDV